MFDEEERPRPKNLPVVRDLTRLSVDELDEYTAWLEEEITRVKSDKQKKISANSAAAKLFK